MRLSQIVRPLPVSVLLSIALALGFATVLASTPPDLGDGWRVSRPEDQAVESAAFTAMVAQIERDPVFSHAYALLLLRHGTLIGERYFQGRRADQVADVRSVTKSVTSLAMGVAREEGLLPRSVQTPLRVLLPHYASILSGEKAGITLFDALTMQSGLDWGENELPWFSHLLNDPEIVDYVLSAPLVGVPGETFLYSTGLSQVLGAVVIEATGRPLANYVDDRLFRPLGIDDWSWLKSPSGDHFGGFGLSLRPRDMARIGQMALQDGNWQGLQIVPIDWMLDSTRDRTSDGVFYGYQWWGAADSSNFEAIGYGGQYIFVHRPSDIVIVLQVDWDVPADRHIAWESFRELWLEVEGRLLPSRPGTVRSVLDEEIHVSEAAGEIVVPIERFSGSDGALEVAFEIRNGTARAGRDYRSVSGSLVWRSGELGTKRIVVPILDDAQTEGPETFEIVLRRLAGAAEMEIGPIAVTIDDDEGQQSYSVAWKETTAIAREGGSVLGWIERSSSEGPLTLGWSVVPITGDVADVARSSGLVVFAAGESEARLELPLIEDGRPESLEILALRLGSIPDQPPIDLSEDDRDLVVGVMDSSDSDICDPAASLCLRGGRFRVRAVWRSQLDGRTGQAGYATLSDESGWMSFFRPGRLELLLKILDGQAINGSDWVFFGALTDVEYFVAIEDLLGGATRFYINPPGSLCGQVDLEAFESLGLTPASPQIHPGQGLARGLGDTEEGEDFVLLGRFRAEVIWHDPRTGTDGMGHGVALSDETGLQWFFDEKNVELAIKVLDGTTINDHYWVFAGSVTDLDYTVTILDTLSGATRSYESGEPLCGLADTEAFRRAD